MNTMTTAGTTNMNMHMHMNMNSATNTNSNSNSNTSTNTTSTSNSIRRAMTNFNNNNSRNAAAATAAATAATATNTAATTALRTEEDETYDQYAYEDDTVMPDNTGMSGRMNDRSRNKSDQEDDDSDNDDLLSQNNNYQTNYCCCWSNSNNKNSKHNNKHNQCNDIRCVKWTVLLSLILSGTAVATTAYLTLTKQEQARFEQAFHDDALRFQQAFYHQHTNQLGALIALSTTYQHQQHHPYNQFLPNITLAHFQSQTLGNWRTSDSESIFYAPVLHSKDEQTQWEQYAIDQTSVDDDSNIVDSNTGDGNTGDGNNNNNKAGIYDPEGIRSSVRSISQGIFRLNEEYFPMDDDDDDDDNNNNNNNYTLQAPIWQINPPKDRRHVVMFNLNSLAGGFLSSSTTDGKALHHPYFGPILKQEVADFFVGRDDGIDAPSGPRSLGLLPMMQQDNASSDKIIGVTGIEVEWISYFANILLLEGHKTDIVLENTCQQQQAHTYQVIGKDVSYRGRGDLHDAQFNAIRETTTKEGFIQFWDQQGYPPMEHEENDENEEQQQQQQGQDVTQKTTTSTSTTNCVYGIAIYPTKEYESEFYTPLPLTYALVAAALTIMAVILFGIYVYLADRRQRQVLDSAAKSNAIIKSLFPAVVRDRLFGGVVSGSGGGSHHNSHLRRGSQPHHTNHSNNSNHPNQHHHHLQRGGGGGDDNSTNPKGRLTNFLTSSSSTTDVNVLMIQQEDEPIAEMFSNTTVMFADIAGFTAWSSEREPAQVFKLLETLYHEFDTIARRLNVFKVETIGDCYVAVAGLPQPTKDHAKTMARFAYEILLGTVQLTQQLEAVLGPGTSDLGLRIGLHSGPVTAGVLRGAKSRFQLFGDTMNTSARMESTGQVGKIHISQATADLLSAAGKHHWLTQRDGTITAKGKGEMQTHWCMIRRAAKRSSDAFSNQASVIPDDDGDGDENEAEDEVIFDQPDVPPTPTTQLVHPHRDSRAWGHMAGDTESITSRYSFTNKEDRLIDWNVDVLMTFLEKVVHQRLVTETHNPRWAKPTNSFGKRGPSHEVENSGLIIDEVADVMTLPKFNSRYSPHPAANTKLLPPEIRAQMKEFVASIASMYRDVPFHNFEHASHVTMSANKLMKRIITPEDSSKKGSSYQSDLHFNTFGISSDPLTQFAVVFAALIHDVDHTGLSNAQLVKENATIARIFNNKSVAEQNSVVVAWELLMEPRYEDLQQCIFAHDSGRKRFRQLVVNAVMATDIMDPDMVSRRKKRWEKAFDPSLAEEMFLLDVDVNRKATIVIEHIIQASDVAHTMQHWHIFIRWNVRLYRELHLAFTNGHSDQDPCEGWYEDQLSFLDNYVIPLAKKLRECGVFGVSGDEYLTYAQLNRSEWERKGREETRKMIRQNRGVVVSSLSADMSANGSNNGGTSSSNGYMPSSNGGMPLLNGGMSSPGMSAVSPPNFTVLTASNGFKRQMSSGRVRADREAFGGYMS